MQRIEESCSEYRETAEVSNLILINLMMMMSKNDSTSVFCDLLICIIQANTTRHKKDCGWIVKFIRRRESDKEFI